MTIVRTRHPLDPTPRTARGAATARGLVLLAISLLAASVAEADDRLFAPLVRGGERSPTVSVSDRSGDGALVDLYFRHASGEPLRFGRHPVTITRAVPPGETVVVALDEFLDDDFDGTLEVHSTDEIVARVDQPVLAYDLVDAVTEATIDVRDRSGDHVNLASCAIDRPTIVEFAYGTAFDGRATLEPFAALRRRVEVKGATIDATGTAPFALLVWQSEAEGVSRVFLSR